MSDENKVMERLEELREAYEMEYEMANEKGNVEKARYHHGKVVAIQSAIDAVKWS